MKAEHRKELETNLLADRMGNLIKRMKGGPQRRTIVYVFLVLLLLGVGGIVYIYFRGDRQAVALAWIEFDFGHQGQMGPESANASGALELQRAHYFLWNHSISMLGSDPSDALATLDDVEGYYKKLSNQQLYKDNKLWAAEVDYALAVIEETWAAVDLKKLESAKGKFEQVAEIHKDTPFGELALRRKKEFADKDSFKKIRDFYEAMNARLYLGSSLKLLDDKRRNDAKIKQQQQQQRNFEAK